MRKFLLLAVLSTSLCSALASAPKILSGKTGSCKVKIGDVYAGGIVFYVSSGTACHGLVCAPTDQAESVAWHDAVTLCESLKLGGYSDWRLPTKDELNQMYTNLYKAGFGRFSTNYYWSDSDDDKGFAYAQYFNNSSHDIYRYVFKRYTFCVRAIRVF